MVATMDCGVCGDPCYGLFEGRCSDCARKYRNKELAIMARGVGSRHNRIRSLKDWAEGHEGRGRRVVQWRNICRERKPVVFVFGKRGVGKTQFACSFVIEQVGASQWARVETAMAIRENYTEIQRQGKDDPLRLWLLEWQTPTYLFIDEWRKPGTDKTRELFDELVDRRYRDRKTTVFIGNYDRNSAQETLTDSILSRGNEGGKGWGMEFDWESFRE